MSTTSECTRTLRPADRDYPSAARRLLRLGWSDLPDIHVRGELPKGPGLAVVGSRIPSPEAVAWSRREVRRIADDWVPIWSGGATGIDAEAHRAALAAGVPTVVVTAGGLDTAPFPAEHAELFQQVLDTGGALVSLEPDGAGRKRDQFLRRNLLLAALTPATLVVEARAERSGARHMGRSSLQAGSRVMVVPQAPWSSGGGCALLLTEGAMPVTCATDVLAVLAGRSPYRELKPPRARSLPLPAPPPQAPAEPIELDPEQERALSVLGPAPIHLDLVCQRTGMSAAEASRALLTCTLAGLVVEEPPGHFRREENGT